MEIQEVINKFNGLLQGIIQDDMQDALTVAIKVLEKQIPKTSVFTSMDDGFDEVCPVCGYDVASKYERYCQGCGQAIKR